MLRPVWGTTGRTPARRQRLLCGFGLPRGRLQRTTVRGRNWTVTTVRTGAGRPQAVLK